VVTVRGVRFAFLGYFFLGTNNIEPPQVIATDTTPGVAGHVESVEAVKAMLSADMRAAKKRADHVIAFFHWGREGRTTPEPYQVELGHLAIDVGASAVIGSHPHVLQGIEVYRGAPIAYSLGNFVFGGNWNPRDKRTALLHVSFEKSRLLSTEVIPAMSDAYPERPVQPYFPSDGGVVLSHLTTLSEGFGATIPALRRLDAGVSAPPAAP
ncbi:MAG: CapA family protein, partial [Archangium sp.]|nr:CapA family protein [Archangium sp.]